MAWAPPEAATATAWAPPEASTWVPPEASTSLAANAETAIPHSSPASLPPNPELTDEQRAEDAQANMDMDVERMSREDNRPLINLPKPDIKGPGSAFVNRLESGVEGLVTRNNIALAILTAGAPPVLQKAVGAGFTALMAKGAGDALGESFSKLRAGDTTGAAGAAGDAVATAALAALGAKHGAERPGVTPELKAERKAIDVKPVDYVAPSTPEVALAKAADPAVPLAESAKALDAAVAELVKPPSSRPPASSTPETTSAETGSQPAPPSAAESAAPAAEGAPDAPAPQWLKDNNATLAEVAEKSGAADKIEELHAQRFTARQIADRLGVDVDMVRAVRATRQLPDRTDAINIAGGGGTNAPDAAEFTAWVEKRNQKTSPTDIQSVEAAPAGQSVNNTPERAGRKSPLDQLRELEAEGAPDVRATAAKLSEETGLPAVSIADLAERSGESVDGLKEKLLEAEKRGEVVLSLGDESLASPAEKAAGIPRNGELLTQVRFLEEAPDPSKVSAYASKLPTGPQAVVRDVLLRGKSIEEASSNSGMTVKRAQEAVDKARGFLARAKTVEKLPERSYADEPAIGGRSDAIDEVALKDAGDWTEATEDAASQIGMKRGAGQAGAVTIPKFADRKMSELDLATTHRSAKLQKSFDEATRAQKQIGKAIPSVKRQGAVSVWMEADGDAATLAGWEAGAKGEAFREAARLAQTLTPEEIAIARKAQAAFKVLAARGAKFDVLKSGRANYVPHVWDVEKRGAGFGGGKLQQNFKFAKARTFDTFADGDAADFTPKTLAIGKLLPAYLSEMNKVIADRQFVQDLAGRTAKDGRPLVLPRGRVSEIETAPGDKAYLANPRAQKGLKDAAGNDVDTSDYKTMEGQPALHDWRWEGKDADGNPIYMKDDLAVHPEGAKRLNAMLGKSQLREWMNDPTHEGSAKILPVIAKALDRSQSVMKREMFGLLAPFHQVQEGWHGIAHWVNPFTDIPKIDLRDAGQMDAARHGLMILPDRTSAQSYMEGVGSRGTFLTQAARALGEKADQKLVGKAATALADVVDGYQNYLFHQYIPGLKLKTYEAIRTRNTKVYAKELASGKLTEADVKLLSAEQANAAYGHLNYALLDRNPLVQHLLQLSLLAPDFLEARGRFTAQAIKGLTGSKVGAEQFIAIARIAAVQAAIAFTVASLAGGEWDAKHPFEASIKGRRYTLRSVPEDIASLITDTRQFAYGRVNPLVVKGAVQGITGLNYRGEKTTALETAEELLAQYIPITARSIPALRGLTETSRQNPVTPLEQLAGSLGLRISRKSPISDTYKIAADWMDKKGEVKDKGSYPVSKYQQLRYALEDGDMSRAGEEYDKLKQNAKPHEIAIGFAASINHPFTKSQAMDAEFRKSLKPHEREMFDLAKKKRSEINTRFQNLRRTGK